MTIIGKATVNGERVNLHQNPVNHWVFDGCKQCHARLGPGKQFTTEETYGKKKIAFCVVCHPVFNVKMRGRDK